MNKSILIAMDRASKIHGQSVLNVANDGGGGYYQAPADIAACAADAAWLDDVDCHADSAHADYWISNYFESTGKDNNKFVLIARDRESYTNEELKRNAADAAAYAAADAAAYSDAAAYAKYWVFRYFEITGEDKQTYLNAIKGNK